MILQELSRDAIAMHAPRGTAILPTASIEQHGPHLPVGVDTLLCSEVVHRAVAKAEEHLGPNTLFVAPVFSWGNSHHHRPFAGVLSLESDQYIGAVHQILEGLLLAGFPRLLIVNGHGGNTAPNRIVAQDFVHRHGKQAVTGAADYWDIGRQALTDAGLITSELIPGHAGIFESALMRAVRPDLVSEAGMAETRTAQSKAGRDPWHTEVPGAWVAADGYSDQPSLGTVEQGQAMLDVLVESVAEAMTAFHQDNSAPDAESACCR